MMNLQRFLSCFTSIANLWKKCAGMKSAAATSQCR
jgi:hypothetical protein